MPDGASEAHFGQLHGSNTAAVRPDYVDSSVLSWDGAKVMTPAPVERKMHIEMLTHAERHMQELARDLAALSVEVFLDHIGWRAKDRSPDSDGFQILCRLLADSRFRVKRSAIYQLLEAHY